MGIRYTFKKGEVVVRRPGTLGASGERGVVEMVDEDNGHYAIVTVRFPTRRERFAADTYVRATIYADQIPSRPA
jgi:hypothetical protein